jgi:hypothetical protein
VRDTKKKKKREDVLYFQLARVSQANYNRGGVIYEGDDREIRQGFKKWGVCVRVWGGGRYVEDF